MRYYHIKYENGSNSYIALNYNEVRKLKRKYKDRMKKTKNQFYYILEG